MSWATKRYLGKRQEAVRVGKQRKRATRLAAKRTARKAARSAPPAATAQPS